MLSQTLQIERDELQTKSRDLEELASKNSGSKSQLTALKQELLGTLFSRWIPLLRTYLNGLFLVLASETKNRDQSMELTRLEYEAEKYKTESDTLASENARFREELRELQTKVQELEVTGGVFLLSSF